MTITVYGIPNCDTVRKARAWLAGHAIGHSFHDFRRDGLADTQVERWIAELGWEKLVNRKGSTWRQLPAKAQAAVTDAAAAKQLMLGNVSVIRRPVVDWGEEVTVGFDPDDWALRLRGS